MDKDLFGIETIKTGKFNIYHDESGNYKTDRWFLTGLLFIFQDKVEEFCNDLLLIKKKYKAENYEIHFSDLCRHSSQSNVANDWLDLFISELYNYCFFSCLAVDTRAKRFDSSKFPKRYHAYNRFTVMALKSAIRWFFKDYKYLEFKMISDEKSRNNRDISDNFKIYVPNRIEDEWEDWEIKQTGNKLSIHITKKYNQELEFDKTIDIKSSKNDILLQFCDILLGAVSESITYRATREMKLLLAEKVYYWLLDIREKPWKQNYKLHKILNLVYFPNVNGRCDNEGELKIKEWIERDQLEFF